MRDEVMQWAEEQADAQNAQGPFLEVGSYDVNGSVRKLFSGEYTALDMRDGPGVDVVYDFCGNTAQFCDRYNTVLCFETLEHMRKPWRALHNMFRALKPGGLLLATWIFNFPIHEYPNDYWRVTPEGFKAVLEDAGFTSIEITEQGNGPVGVFAVARA